METNNSPPISAEEERKMIKAMEEVLSDCNTILLASDDLMYFGNILYGIKKRVIARSLAEQMFKNMQQPPLGWTDGDVISILAEQEITTRKTLFVLLHELLHIITMTMQRKGDRDMFLWNLATDHCINSMLRKISESLGNKYVHYYEDCFIVHEIYDKDPDLKYTAERVYEYIKQEFEKGKIQIEIMGGSGGSGSGGSGKGSSKSQGGKQIIKVKYKGREYYSTANDVDNDPTLSDSEKDELKKTMEEFEKEMSDKAKTVWHGSPHSRGTMPGCIVSAFDRLYEIKIPWNRLLENAIKYSSQNREDRSWSWPNEVFRHLGIHLPGNMPGEEISTLVVVIDTSGSISDDNLNQFVSVLRDTAHIFNRLRVIYHDYVVQGEFYIDGLDSFDQILDKFKEYGIPGRGGTSHKDAFDRIQKLHDMEGDSEKISSIMFLTDFYSDVEHIYHEYEFMREFETIWALVSTNVKDITLQGCDTKTVVIEELVEK